MKNKIIDFHSHPHFDNTSNLEITKYLMEQGFPLIEKRDSKIFLVSKLDGIDRPVEADLIDAKIMLSEMEQFNIVHQIKLASPWTFRYELREKTMASWLARLTNDKIVEEWVDPYPNKFSGGCTVPMQFPELAIIELHRCAKLGYHIVTIGTSVNQLPLHNPMFDIFWKEVCKLDMKIFVHPHEMTGPADFWLQWLHEMPTRTRDAMASFLMFGIFERFPDLKVIFSHGGTSWFAEEGRRQYGYKVRKDLVKKDPNRFIDKIYIDSHTSDPELLAIIIHRHGKENILAGFDSPFALGEWPSAQNPDEVPGSMISSIEFGDETIITETREKLFYKNAERLLERTF